MPLSNLLLDFLGRKNFKKDKEGEVNRYFEFVYHKRSEVMIRRLPKAAGEKINFKQVAFWFEEKLLKYRFPFPENLFPITGVMNAVPAGAEFDDESEDEASGYVNWLASNIFFSTG